MIVPFDYEVHGPMVSGWLMRHSFPLLPPEMLPKTGVMIDDTACGFLYLTDSKVGWMEWIFANPEKTKEERAEAIDRVIQWLEQQARFSGMLLILSASKIPAYYAILERNGFSETENGMTHHCKILRKGA